jgi:zinc/manganese transport system permease protein
MRWQLVFDPLFRVPFTNGLLLAATVPLLGAYVRLRDEWLAALGVAEATAAGGVVAMLLGLHPIPGALGAASLAAGAKGVFRRSGNDVFVLLLLLGWSVALLGAANSARGEEVSHALIDGQLYFTGSPHLIAAGLLAAAVAVLLPLLSRRLLLERFFPDYFAVAGARTWRLNLVFDLLVAFSVAVSTQSVGVMAAFALVFLPPWAAFTGAAGWRRALLRVEAFSLTAYVVAFAAAILLNQPFGPVLVATLLLASLPRAAARRAA